MRFIDQQTQLRVTQLAREAVPFSLNWVLYREPNLFMFLPLHECKSSKFRDSAEQAFNEGAICLGAIALLNETTPEHEPVFGYELTTSAPEEAMIRAKLRYRDNLIEAGILTVGDAAQC